MLYLSEAVTDRLVNFDMAMSAIREALVAAAGSSDAVTFPTLQGHGRIPEDRFAIKTAHLPSRNMLGFKFGTYWPSSDAVGLPRPSSTIVFVDEQTGRIQSMVVSGAANAYRTAAADALAVDLLARRDASRLALFGAGYQPFFDVMAISQVRTLTDVLVVNRTAENGRKMIARLAEVGIAARLAAPRDACEAADIIVTATPARMPLLEDSWIRPGTHISCMGADAKGKQELPPALLRRSSLFADHPAQSLDIGEFESVAGDVTRGSLQIVALGDVARGVHPGRTAAGEITIFDTSGLALQDLFIARALLDEAERRGELTTIR